MLPVHKLTGLCSVVTRGEGGYLDPPAGLDGVDVEPGHAAHLAPGGGGAQGSFRVLSYSGL